MKKKFFVLLTTLFLCCAFTLGFALGGCSTAKFPNSKGLEYTLLNENTYEVVGIGDCMDTDIGIPSRYKGKVVTSIGENAFARNERLTSVVIPDSITSIGEYAFGKCYNIKSVTIGKGVTSIGNEAFKDCHSMQSFAVSKDNANYTSQDGILYNKAKTEMLFVPANLTGAVTIPEGLASIPNGAFYYRANLTSTTLPASLISIGVNAFKNCAKLKSITISDDNAVYASQDGIVYNKAKTEFIYIPTNVTGAVSIPYGITTIPISAFEARINLTSVTIPDSVTTIFHHAFFSCDSLKNVVFGENVTSIGNEAFGSCSSLTSVTVPEGLTSIGSRAFSDSVQFNEYGNGKYLASKTNDYFILVGGINREITSCDIHADTKMIAPDAFYDYDNLTEIVIPDGVTMVGSDVFYGCRALTVYCEAESQPSGWNSDWNSGCSLVWDCKNNEVATDGYIYVTSNGLRYQLKDGVATVAEHAKNITAANISKSVIHKGIEYLVTSIGDSAFYGCAKLTIVTIPESVKSIGEKAFIYCDNLQFKEYKGGKYLKCGTNDYFALIEIERYRYHYSIHNDTKIIARGAFRQCDSAEVVVIGDSVTSISEEAFLACAKLRGIIISDSVTFIGDSAFSDCKSLTSVYYKGTESDWSNIEMDSYNSKLTSATIYYYIEKEEDVPTDGGNYWHYDENEDPVAW